jgi:uncharacterized protein (TIGR02452 family)
VRLCDGERPGVAQFGSATEAAVSAWDSARWQREWESSRHDNERKRHLLKLVADDNRKRVARALSGSVVSPVWWPSFAVEAPKLFPSRAACAAAAKGPPPRVTFGQHTTGAAVRALGTRNGSGPPNCVALNFACGTFVGGCYVHGGQAQEEDLCRQFPMLYAALDAAKRRGMYPFGPGAADSSRHSTVLFVPSCALLRGEQSMGYPVIENDPEEVVTAAFAMLAAPDLGNGQSFDRAAVKAALVNAFVLPKEREPGLSCLIAGAWGCGAYQNDPTTMATIFAEVIREWGHLYTTIHFAIPPGRNFDVFSAIVTSLGAE